MDGISVPAPVGVNLEVDVGDYPAAQRNDVDSDSPTTLGVPKFMIRVAPTM